MAGLINARSIIRKELSLEILSMKFNIELLCVTETWLAPNSTPQLRGFKMLCSAVRTDTTDGKFGGVAIFQKDSSNICVQQCYEIQVTKDCQVIHLTIQKLNILYIYRSPNQTEASLSQVTDFIKNFNKPNLVIAGDLNMPEADFVNNATTPKRYKPLVQAMITKGLENHVTESTHHAGNILDIVLGPSGTISDVEVLQDQTISDHFPVLHSFILQRDSIIRKVILSHKDLDVQGFQRELYNSDWLQINYNDVDQAADAIAHKIRNAYAKHVPVKEIIIDQNKPLYLQKTVKLINKCRQLRSMPAKICQYKKAMHQLDEMIKVEQSRKNEAYLKHLCGNKKNIYQVFSKRSFQRKITCIKSISNGILLTEDRDIADELNLFYASIFVKSGEVDLDWDDLAGASITDIEVTPDGVKQAIRECKMSTGLGPDGVSTFMLKSAIDALVFPLTTLFQNIMSQSRVPQAYKVCLVDPIPKKGDPTMASNTRPINKASVISKRLEDLWYNQVYEAIEERITNRQWGFVREKSTIDSLIDYTDFIERSMHEGKSIITLSVDFKKAFDVCCHAEVLKAIHALGVRKSAGRFLSEWLKQRTQFVKIGDYESPHVQVTSSICQGAVVATLLFISLVNTLPECMKHCHCWLFADDVRASLAYSDMAELWKFTSDMDRIYSWATDHKLKINLDKTCIMQFGPTKPDYQFRMAGTKINVVNHMIDLGLDIFNTPNAFQPHGNTVTARVKTAMAAANQMMRNAPFHVRKFVYQTYIQPIFDYGAVVYTTEKTRNNLDEAYKKFFKNQKLINDEFLPLTPSEVHILRQLQYVNTLYENNLLWTLPLIKMPTQYAIDHGLRIMGEFDSYFVSRPKSQWREPLSSQISPLWNILVCKGIVPTSKFMLKKEMYNGISENIPGYVLRQSLQ